MATDNPTVRRLRCTVAAPILALVLALVGGVAVASPQVRSDVHVYEVVLDGKPGSRVSLLPPEHVSQRGLPALAIIGSLRVSPAHGGDVVPANFEPNPAFVAFLLDFVGRTAPTDPGFARSAREQGDGWIYIIDARTPTPMGEVPLEDIIGAFEVRQGRLVGGSWQPMDSHRLVTERGLFRLSRFLEQRLLDALRQLPAVDEPRR